jgi:DNA-binding transcriptional LysR family regulator
MMDFRHRANLRQLEMFRLLMRTFNLTETARILRVSQPAISQTLRNLETDLGFELFNRGGRRITPTNEALTLLPEVERLFSQFSTLESRANELRDGRAGSLSIATIPTLTHRLIPKACAALRGERPHVRIEIEATTFLELINLIKQEIADVGFGYGPTMEHGVAVEAIFQTRIVCFVPEHHPLANRKALCPQDLEGTTVIVLRPTTPIGILIHEVLEKQDFKNIKLLRTNSGSAAVGLAVQGVGIALTDVMALYAGGARGVRIVPFEPAIPLTLAAIYSRHRPVSRGLVQFIAHVRATLRDICNELHASGLPGEVV